MAILSLLYFQNNTYQRVSLFVVVSVLQWAKPTSTFYNQVPLNKVLCFRREKFTHHGHRGEYSQALSLYKGRDNNKKLNYSEGDTDSSAPSRNNHSCLYYEQRQEWGITKPSFVGQVMSPSCRRWEGRGRHKGFISTKTMHVTAVCSAQVRRSETVQWWKVQPPSKELVLNELGSISLIIHILFKMSTPENFPYQKNSALGIRQAWIQILALPLCCCVTWTALGLSFLPVKWRDPHVPNSAARQGWGSSGLAAGSM